MNDIKLTKGPILIVDDDKSVLESRCECLEDEGYFTIRYSRGDEAIKAIEEGLLYKLAVIDLNLFISLGEDVIKVSKKFNPTIPIVSFSGVPSRFKPKDIDGHIEKLATYEKIIEKYKELVEKKWL